MTFRFIVLPYFCKEMRQLFIKEVFFKPMPINKSLMKGNCPLWGKSFIFITANRNHVVGGCLQQSPNLALYVDGEN